MENLWNIGHCSGKGALRCVDIVVPPVLLEGTSPWRRRRRERERRTKVSGWANFWLWWWCGFCSAKRRDDDKTDAVLLMEPEREKKGASKI